MKKINKVKNTIKEKEVWHICKVVSVHNCTYEAAREKYGKYIDEKGFIPLDIIRSIKP